MSGKQVHVVYIVECLGVGEELLEVVRYFPAVLLGDDSS